MELIFSTLQLHLRSQKQIVTNEVQLLFTVCPGGCCWLLGGVRLKLFCNGWRRCEHSNMRGRCVGCRRVKLRGTFNHRLYHVDRRSCRNIYLFDDWLQLAVLMGSSIISPFIKLKKYITHFLPISFLKDIENISKKLTYKYIVPIFVEDFLLFYFDFISIFVGICEVNIPNQSIYQKWSF